MTDASADCDEMLNAIMPFVEQTLGKYGEFYPVGMALGVDDKIVVVAGATEDDRPASNEVMAIIKDGFIEGAHSGRFKATALAYDVRVTLEGGENSDAIAVAVDHRDGYSVISCFPYKLDRKKVIIDEARAFSQRGKGEIFLK